MNNLIMLFFKKLQFITYRLLAFMTIILALSSCSSPNETAPAVLLIENRLATPKAMYEIYSYSVGEQENNLEKLIEFSRKNVYWLSPDGQHIALLTPWEADGLAHPQHSLTIIDLFKGTPIDQIADAGRYDSERDWAFVSDESIVWSPTGDKFIFERNSASGQGVDLWVYDLKNTSTNALTMDEATNWNPAWSPDGEKIAFTSRKPCGKAIGECTPEEEYWDIVVIDGEGTGEPTVFDFRDTDFFVDDPYIVKSLCNLQWSPDGDRIAFENRCSGQGEAAPHDVFILDLKSGQINSVTNFVKSPDSSSIFDYGYWFTWSQTGDELYIGYSKHDILNNSFSLAGGFSIVDTKTLESINTAEIYGLLTRRGWSSDTNSFIGFTKRIENGKYASGPTLLGQLNELADLTLLTNSSKLPYGSCDEPKAYWSPDDFFIAYAMGDQFGDCTQEESGREIGVVSVDNGTFISIPLKGDIRPIGWLRK